VFHVSVWKGLEICLGGKARQSSPVATGLVQRTLSKDILRLIGA